MKNKMKKHEDYMLVDDLAARSFYGKVNPQRLQEVMDSRKVQEDHNAVANLSPKAFAKIFNPNQYMDSFTRNSERYDVGE